MKFRSRISVAVIAAFVLSLLLGVSNARNPQDDNQGGNDRFVRLVNAKSIRMMEIQGKNYRKAEGPAKFLHNDTWLICDTALWNVDDRIIYAIGNVRIEQENTELTGDRLTYLIDSSVAQFRGSLVELKDRDRNTLRTRNLDYYTSDSVAVFCDGASMRDKDGQVIESLNGRYEAKKKLFSFRDNVNMFSDSVFVKTSALEYHSSTSLATFPVYTEAWKDESMLSGDEGWYNNEKELFFFRKNVHVLSEHQEGWCDSLYYDKGRRDIEMRGNTQVVDESRGVTSLAGQIKYVDALSRVTLHRDPVVLLSVEDKKDSLKIDSRDTVYIRADTMVYWTVPKCAVDSMDLCRAAERLQTLADDPVANVRQKAAEAAAKARQEALDNDPNTPPELRSDYKKPDTQEKPSDSLSKLVAKGGVEPSLAVKDTLAAALDSASVAVDSTSIAAPLQVRDSTRVGYARAVGKVKIYRAKMQVVCDSLRYCDLDSLARLFKDPIVWNDIRHQYMSDSLFIQISGGKMTKAALLSNAFIHIKEDEKHYDQIRAAEMTAFFDESTRLSRFDAMGSANAVFYMKEKERISTANKKEASILTAEFKDEELQRISYYEAPKSNAFPVAQMKREDKFLKGYKWMPDARPASASDITTLIPRSSQRLEFESHPRAQYPQTKKYFPGYMARIYREIERSDSLRKAAAASRPSAESDSVALAISDSLTRISDSLSSRGISVADSLKAPVDSATLRDSIVRADSVAFAADSLKRVADSLYNAMTPAQKKAFDRKKERERKRAEYEAKVKARQEAREARWAELDERDRQRREAREAAKAAKKAAREKKEIERLLKRKQEEDELYEKYKQKYLIKYGYGQLKEHPDGTDSPE